MRLIFLAACAALSVSACGTITRGTSEQVAFLSEPAGAAMQTSKGYSCPSTPCTLDIDRKDEFLATFTLPGYRSETVPVKSKLVANGGVAFAGNLLLGGAVGMGVDAATGAPYDHTPNPVSVTLTPEKPEKPVVRRSRPRRATRAPEG
jgi:hypothetical protein